MVDISEESQVQEFIKRTYRKLGRIDILVNAAGIRVTGSGNRIEANHVTNCDQGIDVDNEGNLIVKNSATGNTNNYAIVPNNTVGPIITDADIQMTCNPHANYEL